MYIEKPTVNTIRKILKTKYSAYETCKRVVDEQLNAVDSNSIRDNWEDVSLTIIKAVNSACKTDYSYRLKYEELADALKDTSASYKAYMEGIQSMLSALSKYGFQSVTYRLPLLTSYAQDRSIAISFVIASGIKKNGTSKDLSSPLMDSVELKMYALEKKMAPYISDDIDIDIKDLIPFLTLYREYLETAFLLDDNFDKNNLVENKYFWLLTMGLYIVYSSEFIIAEPDDMPSLNFLLENFISSGIVSPEEAVDLVTKHLIYNVNKMIANLENKKSNKKDPLEDYIQNGEIIACCDLSIFKELVASTSLDEAKKAQLVANMASAIELKKNEERKQALKDLRETILDDADNELYNLAHCYKDTASIVDDIDATIELMLECTTGEDKNALFDDLESLLDTLRKRFASITNIEGDSQVVYYPCKVKDDRGEEVGIPSILRSIIANKMNMSGYFNEQFLDLLDGKTERDRKIKLPNLPCPIWMKGRELRIFYTRIGDVTVIIDAANEFDALAHIEQIARSTDFCSFLEEVRVFIAKGGSPKSMRSTDLIKTALYCNNKIIKLV